VLPSLYVNTAMIERQKFTPQQVAMFPTHKAIPAADPDREALEEKVFQSVPTDQRTVKDNRRLILPNVYLDELPDSELANLLPE
jgi:hypothetical protein